MDMKLTAVSTHSATRAGGLSAARAATRAAAEPGFQGALSSALRSVSQAQDRSMSMQKEVLLENPQVSLEETMASMQKAQIGFQSALHVRNRMVQAYTDIMNMQV